MLTLPIKKKWFDMIVSGEKKEEYREIKPYYISRFNNLFTYNLYKNKKNELWYLGDKSIPEEVIFKNGYKANSPKIKCSCRLTIGKGKEEWGAEPNKEYFILKIEEIISNE